DDSWAFHNVVSHGVRLTWTYANSSLALKVHWFNFVSGPGVSPEKFVRKTPWRNFPLRRRCRLLESFRDFVRPLRRLFHF
ncbi:MAG: hypothetical protein ABUL66_02005, partial [Verrucomicrobiota bacterium]